MNCPLCNLELEAHSVPKGLLTCPTQILNGIPHYERNAYQAGIKHSLYVGAINLTWWEDESVLKIRLIGDFNILARERAVSLEEVMRIGNRYRNLSAFL